MTPRSVSYYAREVRRELPGDLFDPAPSRLLWLPVHLAIIVVSTIGIVRGVGGWAGAAGMAVAIGLAFGGITFLAHETLHGAVVRRRWVRHLVGGIGFLPFTVSPRLWVAWHNRVHHGHTACPGIDPDAYPTLAEYRSNRRARTFVNHLALGHGSRAGALSLLLGFTVQSAQVLATAGQLGYLSRRQHRLAMLETAAGLAMWAGIAVLIGPLAFLFAYVIPLIIANVVVMGHILTNHSLSPIGEVNDPLLNSLSVTLPRWLEVYTLGFGFHVEHHVFPAMSSRKAPRVREVLRRKWPTRYQSMPLLRALRTVARTGRVYVTPTTLGDPRDGSQWPTLGAGARSAAAAAALPATPPREESVGAKVRTLLSRAVDGDRDADEARGAG